MSGKAGCSGGEREGAGRPSKEPVIRESADFDTDDPIAFLTATMRDKTLDFRARQAAAEKLLAFRKVSGKDSGKKGEQANAADDAAKGKFAPMNPPKLRAVK